MQNWHLITISLEKIKPVSLNNEQSTRLRIGQISNIANRISHELIVDKLHLT